MPLEDKLICEYTPFRPNPDNPAEGAIETFSIAHACDPSRQLVLAGRVIDELFAKMEVLRVRRMPQQDRQTFLAEKERIRAEREKNAKPGDIVLSPKGAGE